MQVEPGVVLPEQPQRHIVLAQRNHPYRFATTDRVLDDVGDDMPAEESILLQAMIGDASLFEDLGVDSAEIEAESLPELDRRSKRKSVQVAQPLCLDLEPVAVMPERFQWLNLDRAIFGDRVVAGVRQ